MLAKDVMVANLHTGWLVLVLEVLRSLAQDRAGVDRVALSHGERPDQVGVRLDDAAGANLYLALDDRVRTDVHVVRKLGLGRNQRRRMNPWGHGDIPCCADWET